MVPKRVISLAISEVYNYEPSFFSKLTEKRERRFKSNCNQLKVETHGIFFENKV